MGIHLDIGGEGRHPGAINVNPWWLTSTTGTAGRPIPDLVRARAQALPFASGVADLITVENAPLTSPAAAEIARVLRPGGTVRLEHPTSYALGAAAHDAVADALRGRLALRTTHSGADEITRTVLRSVALLARA